METKLNIHDNPDAKAWAEEFAKHFDLPDVETMIGWFANAMMAMHDHVKRADKDEEVGEEDIAQFLSDKWNECVNEAKGSLFIPLSKKLKSEYKIIKKEK